MKMIYEYTSYLNEDYDREDWTRIIDDKLGESEQDYLSPIKKTPASYCAKYYLSDYPIIEIICASRGREVTSINHCYKNKYFIIFNNREQDTQFISKDPYDWNTCVEIAEKYRNLTFVVLKNILSKSNEFYIKRSDSSAL